MSSYGALSSNEQGEEARCQVVTEEESYNWRHSLGEKLETKNFHMAVLGLVLLDAVCVAIQLFYTFFHECQVPVLLQVNHPSKESYLLIAFEMAEVISMITCFLFMTEILLALIAFGPGYFLPGWPHWKLHVFDATVIFTTFVLEIGLRGKEREVAGLLIVLRLWRVVKVVEATIMSASFTHREELEHLKVAYSELETKLKVEEEKNRQLLSELGQE